MLTESPIKSSFKSVDTVVVKPKVLCKSGDNALRAYESLDRTAYMGCTNCESMLCSGGSEKIFGSVSALGELLADFLLSFAFADPRKSSASKGVLSMNARMKNKQSRSATRAPEVAEPMLLACDALIVSLYRRVWSRLCGLSRADEKRKLCSTYK